MTMRQIRSGLSIDERLVSFVENELTVDSIVSADTVWDCLSLLVTRFGERNRSLLEKRAELQRLLDTWHHENPDKVRDTAAYEQFLGEIGYLAPEGGQFEIETAGVDDEIAHICGPQLVVPVMNARYALNAANARWGSLYDALYGTDALGSQPPAGPYSQTRGGEVVAWSKRFLDMAVPLAGSSHGKVEQYVVVDSRLEALGVFGSTGLLEPDQFVGYLGSPEMPTSILFRHHDLHIEIVIDRATSVGATDHAGVADVVIESAVTAIMDFEDSVAAVDAEDKVAVYRNWLGLMRRDLRAELVKGGKTITREMAPNRRFVGSGGGEVMCRGTALMLARNVGHLMTTDAVLDSSGNEIFEGALDLVITVACALHDLRAPHDVRNSPRGSVYIVKPKMHGPEEVRLAVEMMSSVEQSFGLQENTVKIGIMDEERRTSLNLKECIREARHRVVFINTGFLDRTGDEIHTSMEAGAMIPKAKMKVEPWLKSYEERNVLIGLSAGFMGRAQIGKGMWAAPDLMKDMLDQKVTHLKQGANCAWVPSPTAATLHATHYHEVNVKERQRELLGRQVGSRQDILTIPVADLSGMADADRLREVDNSCQSILGYVVRWVDQGVGCSKVPDINNVALMEDRATCRISSQHLANWVRHGVVAWDDIESSLRRMAVVVDEQNRDDEMYEPMSPNFDGHAFAAARDLIRSGVEQPSGYTEPILHSRRRLLKAGKMKGNE